MGGKMKPRYIGAYTVVECLAKGRVKLRNESSGKVLKNTYNIANLKCYPVDDITTENELADELQTDEMPIENATTNDLQADDVPTDDVQTDALTSDDMSTDISPSQDVTVLSQGKSSLLKEKKLSRIFKPPLSKDRKKFATVFGLKSKKTLRFGSAGALSKPRRTYKIEGDGNYFFRCVSYILIGSEDAHLNIRDKVIKHMSTIQPKLKEYIDRNPSEYITDSNMIEGGIWATDAEIMATANLLRCDIFVYSKNGAEMDWMNHPASFSLQNTTDFALYIENVNNHYNVVIAV